jgi:hypothetical protein
MFLLWFFTYIKLQFSALSTHPMAPLLCLHPYKNYKMIMNKIQMEDFKPPWFWNILMTLKLLNPWYNICLPIMAISIFFSLWLIIQETMCGFKLWLMSMETLCVCKWNKWQRESHSNINTQIYFLNYHISNVK